MKVAVLGHGIVGVGVCRMLASARGLSLGPVLVREGKQKEPFHVTSLDDILADPSVEAAVEVMGGIEPAFTYASRILESGRHFVTANKALCAAHGIELDAIARRKGVAFLFSAACGGGVPFLHNLALAAESDEIRSVSGILNGTTNYMLDAMQRSGLDYADALKDAQALGYAEADPTADVSGLDALRKMQLGCAVAFGRLPRTGMACEGIEHLTAEDVKDLQSRGLTCRLITRGRPAGKTVSAYVEPTLFPGNAPECSVLENYNMAKYVGENAGPIVLMGQGAGRFPTASAVVRDLSCVLQGQRAMFPAGCAAVEADNSGEEHPYYVRLSPADSLRLPIAKLLSGGESVRAVTESVSVERMHALAQAIRKDGGDLFFAALEE